MEKARECRRPKAGGSERDDRPSHWIFKGDLESPGKDMKATICTSYESGQLKPMNDHNVPMCASSRGVQVFRQRHESYALRTNLGNISFFAVNINKIGVTGHLNLAHGSLV